MFRFRLAEVVVFFFALHGNSVSANSPCGPRGENSALRQLVDLEIRYVSWFIAEFVPVSADCTGKFAGVTGSWIMYAVSEPFLLGSTEPINYSWEGNGQLNFKKGR